MPQRLLAERFSALPMDPRMYAHVHSLAGLYVRDQRACARRHTVLWTTKSGFRPTASIQCDVTEAQKAILLVLLRSLVFTRTHKIHYLKTPSDEKL